MFDAVDGKRTLAAIARQVAQRDAARELFQGLLVVRPGWCSAPSPAATRVHHCGISSRQFWIETWSP